MLTSMSSPRRPRGTVKDSFALYAEISHESADSATHLARQLGVSRAEYVEAALIYAGADLTPEGLPTWWTRPTSQPEELPMTG